MLTSGGKQRAGTKVPNMPVRPCWANDVATGEPWVLNPQRRYASDNARHVRLGTHMPRTKATMSRGGKMALAHCTMALWQTSSRHDTLG